MSARPRIDLERLKREASVLGLLPAGTKVHKVNDHHWRAQCPLHGSKTLTLGIWVEHQGWSFTCFGCNEKGSVIDFAMKLHGIRFLEAVEKLGGGVLEAPPFPLWQPTKKAYVLPCEARGCAERLEVDVADVPWLGLSIAAAWEFKHRYVSGKLVGVSGRCWRCVRKRTLGIAAGPSRGSAGAPGGPVPREGPAQAVKPRHGQMAGHATSTREHGNPPIPASEGAGGQASGERGKTRPPEAGRGLRRMQT